MLGLTLGLVACSDKSSNEPAVQPSGEVVEFSTELAIEAPELVGFNQEGARAFDYKMEANGSKGYPNPKVQFTEGQQVPVLCVIRNTAPFSQANPVIIQKLNFTFKNGKLRAEELPVSLPGGARLDVNRDGWHILCIVGADDFDASTGTASFSSETALPANATFGDTRQLKTLYMNKDNWAKLKVITNSQGKLGFRGAEDIHLVSQGSVLMLRVMNTTTRNRVLRGFDIKSNTLSFAGQIEKLATTTVASGLPKFVGSTTSDHAHQVRLSTPEVAAGDNTVTPGVYMVYAIPDRLNTNKIYVTPRIGDNYISTRTYQYNLDAKANKFYSLDPLKLTKNLTHPIEAMLYNEETGSVFIGPSNTYVETERNQPEGGEYIFPEAEVALALFPQVTGTNVGSWGNNSYGYVNIGDGREHLRVGETIKAFGVTDTYLADYINPSGSKISYAIRFRGGNNNEYLSAYRYERTADNGIKITVRVLGPARVTTSLSQVANETYWNTAPEPGQKEIVRVLPQGKYWTSSTFTGTDFKHIIHVFHADALNTVQADAKNSVYVSQYRAQTDGTRNGNKMPYFVFTSEKN